MNLKIFFSLSGRALDSALTSFSPRKEATSKEIRTNGALCTGIGFLCFILCIPLMYLLNSGASAKLMFLPAMLGYAFIVVGGYRLVFGKKLEAETPYDTSLTRILFGVGWIVLCFGLFIGLAFMLDILVGRYSN